MHDLEKTEMLIYIVDREDGGLEAHIWLKFLAAPGRGVAIKGPRRF